MNFQILINAWTRICSVNTSHQSVINHEVATVSTFTLTLNNIIDDIDAGSGVPLRSGVLVIAGVIVGAAVTSATDQNPLGKSAFQVKHFSFASSG